MGKTTKQYIEFATTAAIADALEDGSNLDELSFKGDSHTKAILTAAKIIHHTNDITETILDLIPRNDKGECFCCGLTKKEDHTAIYYLTKKVKPVKEASKYKKMQDPFAIDDYVDTIAPSIKKMFRPLFEDDEITPLGDRPPKTRR